jgi:hypothetical protein
MKNLNLGRKLSKEEMKQLQGAGVLYFCGGHMKSFSNIQECLDYARFNCFSDRYSCSTVGGPSGV